MSRNISPFATSGASSLSQIGNIAKTGGLFSKIGGSKTTISSLLSGAQKTIGTVNQIIPLYNQVKPMISNSKILLNVAKGLKGDSSSSRFQRNKRRTPHFNKQPNIKEEKTEIKKEEKVTTNSPSKPFFI